ncbi:hypothetical protein SCB49_09105 [unidentified eubacterium SCB49]|nr:hypothetical protein SCB49_09105 [unidentified eubacterium SCB49]
MKNNTKKKFCTKLAKYGALSVAIAGVADATGQVVYTDVDPDFAGSAGSSFAIDFDGDGNDDITILQANNGAVDMTQVDAGTNGVVVNSSGPYFYTTPLASGTLIDDSSPFNSFGSLCYGVGYTGSYFCGSGPGFAGVKFEVDGETHYGWIGLESIDSSNFTVFDYAYNPVANEGVEAGDMTLGVTNQDFNNFEHFINNDVLTLKASTALENVVIYNISGQVVLNKALSSLTETVDLSAQASGVYIAKVSIDGVEKSFKISK